MTLTDKEASALKNRSWLIVNQFSIISGSWSSSACADGFVCRGYERVFIAKNIYLNLGFFATEKPFYLQMTEGKGLK